jgi:maltooligosyltrehalose trehalohydrolase
MPHIAYTSIRRRERRLGAVPLNEQGCRFQVWAPHIKDIELHLISPEDLVLAMKPSDRGYHEVFAQHARPGTRYFYRIDGKDFPDPASSFQPQGVHGPSEVIEAFRSDNQQWRGIPIEDYIIYEMHVGTFTREGTFAAAVLELDRLVDLGITAIEIMPVAQFPGARNWGYDGVFPFAVQNTYGGPRGLAAFVEACHERGLAVVLDVVYNHLGPEGNYLRQFGPYFTDRYKTPWGEAINYDDEYSDEVRRYFIENALYWVTDFAIDALRLDAVHAILDHSAVNILEEIVDAVHQRGTELNRRIYVIAESALNDTRLIRSNELGGYNIDAQWNDDFHHSLHTLLTHERQGYYEDFGDFQHMAQAFSEGFVYSGRYSPSRHRRHGNSSRTVPSHKLVVYAKNHDQIGNRLNGERLTELVPFEFMKLASAVVLLSPFLPMIFMGDEYGEIAPFQYFINHSDPALIDAVRRGRRNEFAAFEWAMDPPDPQDEETFYRSKLNTALHREGRHQVLFEFNRELIRLRKTVPALALLSKEKMDVVALEDSQTLVVRRWDDGNEVSSIFNFQRESIMLPPRVLPNHYVKLLDSDDMRWMGRGPNVPDAPTTTDHVGFAMKSGAVVVLEKRARHTQQIQEQEADER